MRQAIRVLIQQVKTHRMTCAKLLFVLWNTGLLEALLISRPFFREIQFTVNQRMSFATDVSEIDTNLTVINFAKAATPLTGDTPMVLDLIATRISRSALAPGFPRNSE